MSLPKTSLAAVMSSPDSKNRIARDSSPAPSCEVQEIPIPDLEPDSALFKVEYSEVCGTDVYLRDGLLEGVPYPIIPGHVSVGILQNIRGQLCDVEGRKFIEGDRVTFLDVHRTCNQCWHCLVAKATTRCPKRKVYGITYGLEDGLTGGWAEYIYLKPGTQCIRMGDVSSELYMAGGCSLPTALHAVERADISFGDTVLVLGSGPLGFSAIGFSILRGATRVLCIGSPRERLDVASQIGASATLDFTKYTDSQRQDWIMEKTNNRGADVTIECTGSPQAVTQAMRFTRDAGRVVVVGQYTDHGETSFNPHLDLNKKHLEIRGCWGSDYSHFHRSIEMLKTLSRGSETLIKGSVTPVASKMWSHFKLDRFTLSQVDEAMDNVAAAKSIKSLIIPKR